MLIASSISVSLVVGVVVVQSHIRFALEIKSVPWSHFFSIVHLIEGDNSVSTMRTSVGTLAHGMHAMPLPSTTYIVW